MGPRLSGLSGDSIQQVVAAAQALEMAQANRAASLLAPMLARYPDHPEILRLHAGILSLGGEHAAAFEAMQRALRRRPGDALYHNTLATVLAEAGDLDGAVEALRHACALQPDLAVAWYNLGLMLVRSVRYADAIAAFRRTLAIDPKHEFARAQLADVLKTGGDAQGAEAEYRAIIAEKPGTGVAWWGLADIKTLRFARADIDAMQLALRDANTRDGDRMEIGFALAKAFDDETRYADSLAALAEAKTIARRNAVWDARAFSAQLALTDAAMPSLPAMPANEFGREVIFITGLPRSGSTLMEQILASHSQVEGTGELIDLSQVLNEESRRKNRPLAEWARDATGDDWQRLGRAYLQRTAQWRKRKPIFIDKLPGNWVYIGAIRAMLPGARVICCRRDALETCFACYRQYLPGNPYTQTFADLAVYWREFDRSARHWAQCDPRRVHEYSYEALLRDPENAIRRVLDFVGLPFEQACLRFNETQRDVRSPSAMQVRQPLRNTARAHRYGNLLDPLRLALGLPPFADGEPA